MLQRAIFSKLNVCKKINSGSRSPMSFNVFHSPGERKIQKKREYHIRINSKIITWSGNINNLGSVTCTMSLGSLQAYKMIYDNDVYKRSSNKQSLTEGTKLITCVWSTRWAGYLCLNVLFTWMQTGSGMHRWTSVKAYYAVLVRWHAFSTISEAALYA